jgi:hypothetical protein
MGRESLMSIPPKSTAYRRRKRKSVHGREWREPEPKPEKLDTFGDDDAEEEVKNE